MTSPVLSPGASPVLALVLHPPSVRLPQPAGPLEVPSRRALLRARKEVLLRVRAVRRHQERHAVAGRAAVAARRAATDLARSARGPFA